MFSPCVLLAHHKYDLTASGFSVTCSLLRWLWLGNVWVSDVSTADSRSDYRQCQNSPRRSECLAVGIVLRQMQQVRKEMIVAAVTLCMHHCLILTAIRLQFLPLPPAIETPPSIGVVSSHGFLRSLSSWFLEANAKRFICYQMQFWFYSTRLGFDSNCLTAAKIATKMIVIIGIRCRNYTHYTLCRSCLPIYGIAIVRSLSFSFVNDFKETLMFLSLSNPVLQYPVIGT